MTKAEILGGLSGIAIAALGYFVGMALLAQWDAPGFGFLLAITFGFSIGFAGARHRAGQRE